MPKWWTRGGARLGECQEVRPVPDAQEDRRPVARRHGHTKEAPVEIQRALHIRRGESDLVQPQNPHPRSLSLSLRLQPAGDSKGREREPHRSANQSAALAAGRRLVDQLAHIDLLGLAGP